jgi:hypothetical protein
MKLGARVLWSVLGCLAIYGIMTVILKFASEPLLHTSRTVGFFKPSRIWVYFLLPGGVLSALFRRGYPVVIAMILFAPQIGVFAWSGPGDELAAVHAIRGLRDALHFGGGVAYCFLVWRIAVERAGTGLKDEDRKNWSR